LSAKYETLVTLQMLLWSVEWCLCAVDAGRAGRVAQGRVYRLVTFKFWHEQLVDFSEPEMRVRHAQHLSTLFSYQHSRENQEQDW